MKRNQRSMVLEHLKNKRSITSMEAFSLYGVTRLSAIVFDFRQQGHIIHTVMVDGKTRYGDSCKYAKYVYAGEEKE